MVCYGISGVVNCNTLIKLQDRFERGWYVAQLCLSTRFVVCYTAVCSVVTQRSSPLTRSVA